MRFRFLRTAHWRKDRCPGTTPGKFRGSTPIDEIPFVVIDAETTGFDLQHDRILSLAALPVRNGQCQVGEMRSWMVYRADAGVTPATLVHTILPSESSQGTAVEAVLEEFSELITGGIVVGHHISFDAAMINQALRRNFKRGWVNPIVDTAALAMQSLDAFRKTGYSNQRPPGLDEVCTLLDLPLWERHTAEGDTFATAQLFLLLCARMRKSLGRPLMLKDLRPVRWKA